MKLSLVIPIYNEESLLKELKDRLDRVFNSQTDDYEIIFVDDGSYDSSPEILQEFVEKDPHSIVIKLSRNFGHQLSITAGISQADGDALVIMDGDLEDPPEIIPEFVRKWKEGYKVVLGRRRSRQTHVIKKVLFNAFYKIFSFLSDYPIPLHCGVFCLLDKQVYHHLLNLTERNRFIPGLRVWLGFKTASVLYDRQQRYAGAPKQTLSKLFKYALDAIFSFSYKPLRISLFAGIIIFLVSSFYACILIVMRLLQINVVSGFTTIAVSLFFFGGALLVSNGILGEYLGRIYDEVKKRPLYIIDEVLRNESENSSHVS